MGRAFILAAFGWLILANAPQNEGGENKQQYQQQSPTLAVPPSERTIAAQQTEQGCKGTTEPRVSCDAITAQAAIDQARDADKQATLIWPQFAVGGFTLLAAFLAALYARSAATHAGKGVYETRRIGEAQVRCYLTIGSAVATINSMGIVTLEMTIDNSGQSPARNFIWTSEIGYFTARGEVIWDSDPRPLQEGDTPRDMPIGKSAAMYRTHLGRFLSNVEETLLLETTAIVVSASVAMRWKDVFGIHHEEAHRLQGHRRRPFIGKRVKLREVFPLPVAKPDE